MGAEMSLKSKLRRAERLRQLRAFGLILPLLLFLVVTFVVPIADMLRRSVHDPELSQVWPATTSAIKGWTARERLPDEAVFAALAGDLRASRDAATLATAARRLNYDFNGSRTLLFTTARKLPASAPSWTEALIAADPRWGETEVWGAINRASGPLTAFFLMQAVDLERDATGALRGAPTDEAIYIDVLGRTFGISLTVTVLCLLLGFPVAYLLANLPPRQANLLMILVLLPFWTSLLVRTAAWVVLLQDQGLVNNLLIWLGVIEKPLRLMYNRVGVIVAMTHVLLPFMILPLYSVMKGISPVYLRAARSLGATPTIAFLRVYLPQCLPGFGAGALLTFILALGYYITPALVGGAADQMLSYFIAFYTSDTVNWGMASALGAVLLAATLVLYAVYTRLVGTDSVKLS
ncbi:Binding-protein-dependent transport systems inner membrane component [Rhodospirillum rubrum ATCC 11170]|uniref:Binding-protein-dependent transport systems inner membrane component n=2 Tax=Rhodospirillum rubrum TaxID=1085 RepID=Q2RSP9_RHORT|nr:Binding-protein-dependent transport systems inner membrane component [Rhodospirillum rubrum ATCC 11170]MBK5954453.1 polyamine ABC transporter substrate-binding protein [Rhodospirillum rubrum]HAP99732.1 ABC transporter permease [Rhodospirillum rubrum]